MIIPRSCDRSKVRYSEEGDVAQLGKSKSLLK